MGNATSTAPGQSLFNYKIADYGPGWSVSNGLLGRKRRFTLIECFYYYLPLGGKNGGSAFAGFCFLILSMEIVVH